MKVLVIPADPETYLSRGLLRKDLSAYDAVLIARIDVEDATLALIEHCLEQGATLEDTDETEA